MVYADNAASTPIAPEVWQSINNTVQHYGDPSSMHSMGQKSHELIENARDQIAKSINAKPNEIIFTSGATESSNLAIKGYVIADNDKNKKRSHIITTTIEHMSVLNPIKHLYHEGIEVTILPVDGEGNIDLMQLKNSIRGNTILVSIMFANNEIGTIQPINEIGNICKQHGIIFHTDAVSAFGHCDIDVNKLNIGMMSLSGHKIYAPKGIGALYAKDNIELAPLFHGSNQEFGLRSGTENLQGIVGMGKAVQLLDKADENVLFPILKSKLIDGIKNNIPNVKFNGSKTNSLHNIVNVSFEGLNGKDLVMELDSKKIYISIGSPYFTRHPKPPHVLTAIGLSNDLAYGAVRFSFSRYNTENDIDYILDTLPDAVKKLRK